LNDLGPANQLTNHLANRKAKDEDLREASMFPARTKHSCVLETWLEHENSDIYICNWECAYAKGLRLTEGHDVFILGISAGWRSLHLTISALGRKTLIRVKVS
jgi:hypothetical protein